MSQGPSVAQAAVALNDAAANINMLIEAEVSRLRTDFGVLVSEVCVGQHQQISRKRFNVVLYSTLQGRSE